MTFRVRQIDHMADGRLIVRDRIVDASLLTIGRDAHNDIALPDLAVDLDHAVLRRVGSERVSAEALGTLGFDVDGRPSRAETIDIATGAELRFGAYRLGLRRDDHGAILVEVENGGAIGGISDPAEDKRGFSLHNVVRGKRLAAWAMAAAILVLFLAWPISSHLAWTRAQARPQAGLVAPHVAGDAAWNPGPLSRAHRGLSDRCEACHVKPFEAVRDQTCRGCHADTADHADAARLAAAHARAGLGQDVLNRIGATLGREPPGSCAGCHVEHQGAQAMTAPSQQFCADCHANLRERLPGTKLGNAGDFGTRHPQFAATIVADAEKRSFARVSLDDHPQDHDGLIFSHRIHLDPGGGVTRMAETLGAQGYGKALDCAACHRPGADGVRFQPVSMERDCEACHSLAYARSGGTILKLRHGDLDQATADLRRAGTPATPDTPRGRPGRYGAGGLYRADFGGSRAADPLAPDGLCGECHVRVIRGGRPAIGHVTLVDRYLSNGWFDHSAHAQQACADCHRAAASNRVTDVLVPGIATCRNCHLGETAVAPKIASGCVMCHVYHPKAGAPTFSRRRAPQGEAATAPAQTDRTGA